MKGEDEGFVSKRIRRSLSQPQEGGYESIFVVCDSIQDESFVSRSISHQYNCHHVFFTRELLVPYARSHAGYPFLSLSSRFFHAFLMPNRGPVHKIGYILRRVRWEVCLFLQFCSPCVSSFNNPQRIANMEKHKIARRKHLTLI